MSKATSPRAKQDCTRIILSGTESQRFIETAYHFAKCRDTLVSFLYAEGKGSKWFEDRMRTYPGLKIMVGDRETTGALLRNVCAYLPYMLTLPSRWLPCTRPGCGHYEVSDKGEVRHRRRRVVLSDVQTPAGYRYIHIVDEGGTGRKVAVHQMVCWTFHGDRPADHYVPNHKNGIKNDNRSSNLEWVTRSENSRHALDVLRKVCRGAKGSRNAFSRLTEEKVLWIRTERAKGTHIDTLCQVTGCAPPTVYQIIRGDAWKHVGGPIEKLGQRRGTTSHRTKLSEDTVRYIKANRDKGPMPLAKELGLNYSTVHSILSGNSWKHV
jgi:hypothetical protein